jgi:hypothetical protein
MLLLGWTKQYKQEMTNRVLPVLFLEDMAHVAQGLDCIVPVGYDPCC